MWTHLCSSVVLLVSLHHDALSIETFTVSHALEDDLSPDSNHEVDGIFLKDLGRDSQR